jgi:prophage regulatory protein
MPMVNELSYAVARLTELHGRASELCDHLCRDVSRLAQVQQDTSAAVEALLQAQPKRLATSTPSVSTGPRVLRLAEVVRQVGLGRSSIWRMAKEGTFPQPRRLGARSVGWVQAELDDWLKARSTATVTGDSTQLPT